MLYKTMTFTCDTEWPCDAKVRHGGLVVTVSDVTAHARQEGWSISSAGHFCPEHRQRKAKSS